VIEAMTAALEASISTLPEPVSSTHVNLLAAQAEACRLDFAKFGPPFISQR
jgi:hypothetical protein